MTDYRAMCAELTNELQGYKVAHPMHCRALLIRARAALDAQPEPAPTEATTEELLQLAREWNSGHESIEFEFIGDYARAVLARWGNA